MCSHGSDYDSSTSAAQAEADRIACLERLESEICELGAHIDAATCRWLVLLAEFDERGGWGAWGFKSCAQWLSWRCSLAPVSARERVRVASALRELALVREAFGAGELSYSKVRAITRVATPEIEAELVEIARHATGAQLETVVRSYHTARAATLGAAQRAIERRYLNYGWEDDGSLRIQARLTAEDGALLLAALATLEREPDSDPDGRPDSDREDRVGARRADALVDLARCALAAPPGERRGGDPCEVVVHVDQQSLAGDQIHERSELKDGPAIAPETARRLACDAATVRVAERHGNPLNMGRRTRKISPALRRALRNRDRGCRFPGCQHHRYLHAHHIQHWARGGPTELENLVHLCSHHHRLVHEGGYQIERADHRTIRFRRPDGRVIPDAPAPARPSGPTLQQTNHAHNIHPHADSSRALSAGDRLDYGLAIEVLLHRAGYG